MKKLSKVDRLWEENIEYVVKICEGISKEFPKYSMTEVLSIVYTAFEESLNRIDESRSRTRPYIRSVIMNRFRDTKRREHWRARKELQILDIDRPREDGSSHTMADDIPDFRLSDIPSEQLELQDELEHLSDDEKELMEVLLDGESFKNISNSPKIIRGELRRIMQERGWGFQKFWNVTRGLKDRTLSNGSPVWVNVTRASVLKNL